MPITLKQLRTPRIFGIAMFDLIVAMIGLALLFLTARFMFFKDQRWEPFVLAGICLAIPIGIYSHMMFGVNTSLNYRLGLSGKPIDSLN